MNEFYDAEYNVISEKQNNVIIKVFYQMFLGLLATALTSLITYKTGVYLNMPYRILAILEIAVVLIFSFAFRKLSPNAVQILFFSYAIINGLTMTTIFAIFNVQTIFYAFFITALLFGGLAFYGYKTDKDMSKFGTIFSVALIIGFIVSVINMFLGNTFVDIIIDWIMLLVFCGLTAYDMNKIKRLEQYTDCDEKKIYIYGAMELYLDFINIFIRLLSILSRRKD